MTTLPLRKLRELTLRTASRPGRPAHLSAASGLVRVGDRLYVVPDDELHLAVFSAHGGDGELMRLLPGKLPNKPDRRKAEKPDLEVLMRVPRFAGCPHGALLALGSGSKPTRLRGVLLPLDAQGAIEAPRPIDLAGLYAPLEAALGRINIEGAVVVGDHLHLLNRGNKKTGRNAHICVSLASFLAQLSQGGVDAPELVGMRTIELGDIDDVPLCFSDATALPDGSILFAAIAESTENSYEDGACAGAALGVLDAAGGIRYRQRVQSGYKIEGIEAGAEGSVVRVLLVTDPDDELVPAQLLSTEISGFPFP